MLAIVLVIAIAALAFLLWQLFGGDIAGLLGGGSDSGAANIAPGIVTQVGAQSSTGKNISGNLTVNQGTKRPDAIPPEAQDVVLLDIQWTGRKEQTEPVYLTVSDPSFPDGEPLSVYSYDEQQDQWELVDTYRIQDNAVTFLANDMSAFAFQVVSAAPQPTDVPVATTSAEPVATATPEPSPSPTPKPITAVDYGAYGAEQSGVFTMASALEDGQSYVFALLQNMPAGDTAAADTASDDTADTADEGGSDGEVNFTYVDDINGTEDETEGEGEDTVDINDPNGPKATVLLNLGGDTLSTVDMPLVKDSDGTWCLGGPITEGMIWKATRDSYQNDYRFSLENNGRFLNSNDSHVSIILTDNSVRTRWLTESAKLADGSELPTLDYRDNDRYYITNMGTVVETVTDSLFPAGEAPAEPNPLAAQVTYLGCEVPADQTLLRQVMRFTLSTDQTQSKQLAVFKLDPNRTAPEGVQTTIANRITVPVLDENCDLSNLDIRDGDTLLQLGVDYSVAAKVYNNSTVVVVISFMGKYTGQIVRTYEGTYFRTDPSQATPSPEPSPSPTAPPYYGNGGGGGGTGAGSNGYVPPTGSTQASGTDTPTYEDPTDA